MKHTSDSQTSLEESQEQGKNPHNELLAPRSEGQRKMASCQHIPTHFTASLIT